MSQRIRHDVSWQASLELTKLVKTDTPEEQRQVFDAVYRIVANAIAEYEEKADRMHRRVNGMMSNRER